VIDSDGLDHGGIDQRGGAESIRDVDFSRPVENHRLVTGCAVVYCPSVYLVLFLDFHRILTIHLCILLSLVVLPSFGPFVVLPAIAPGYIMWFNSHRNGNRCCLCGCGGTRIWGGGRSGCFELWLVWDGCWRGNDVACIYYVIEAFRRRGLVDSWGGCVIRCGTGGGNIHLA